MVASPGERVASRQLIDRRLWGRLVDRIAHENNVDKAYAERIMDQAVGFLWLCALNPQESYHPSPTVDIGWHTFLLFTRDYAAFCQRIAGCFIHHVPEEGSVCEQSAHDARTVDAMRAAGIHVDESLWLSSGECKGQKCYTCST